VLPCFYSLGGVTPRTKCWFPCRSAWRFNSLLNVHSLLSLGLNSGTPHASPIADRVWQTPASHGCACTHADQYAGAGAHLALRGVPLGPASAGRLFQPRWRTEARCEREPVAAVHTRP